jgi:hypothetical protein
MDEIIPLRPSPAGAGYNESVLRKQVSNLIQTTIDPKDGTGNGSTSIFLWMKRPRLLA